MKQLLTKIRIYFLKRILVNKILTYFKSFIRIEAIFENSVLLNNKIILSEIGYFEAAKGKVFSDTDSKTMYSITYSNRNGNDKTIRNLNKNDFISFLMKLSLQDLQIIKHYIKDDKNIKSQIFKLNKI